jgi:hypothetical protein
MASSGLSPKPSAAALPSPDAAPAPFSPGGFPSALDSDYPSFAVPPPGHPAHVPFFAPSAPLASERELGASDGASALELRIAAIAAENDALRRQGDAQDRRIAALERQVAVFTEKLARIQGAPLADAAPAEPAASEAPAEPDASAFLAGKRRRPRRKLGTSVP